MALVECELARLLVNSAVANDHGATLITLHLTFLVTLSVDISCTSLTKNNIFGY